MFGLGCARCGKRVGLYAWFETDGGKLCAECKPLVAAAELEYTDGVITAMKGGASADGLREWATQEASRLQLPETRLQALNLSLVRRFYAAALADGGLAPHEREVVMTARVGLDVSPDEVVAEGAHYCAVLAQQGELLEVAQPARFMPNKDEHVRLQVNAELVALVSISEYRSTHQSVSFPIGDSGVRYRVGESRGRKVHLGKEIQVQDRGLLTLTSERAVLVGATSTLEVPWRRLVALDVYSDGVGYHLSGRKNAPLVHLPDRNVELVATLSNVLPQMQRGTFKPRPVPDPWVDPNKVKRQ